MCSSFFVSPFLQSGQGGDFIIRTSNYTCILVPLSLDCLYMVDGVGGGVTHGSSDSNMSSWGRNYFACSISTNAHEFLF